MELRQVMQYLQGKLNLERKQELQLEIDLSESARRLLADPLLISFFEVTERDLIEQMVNSKDPDVRDKAQFLIQLTRKYRKHLERFLGNAEFATQQMNQELLGESLVA